MSPMLGCAGMIALVAFFLGFVGASFGSGTIVERLGIGASTAGMAFVAAFVLAIRDRSQYKFHLQRVRQRLLAREDTADDDFVADFTEVDPAILRLTHAGLAKFFDVPPEKIHLGDDLRRDLAFDALEPSLHLFVLHYVLSGRIIEKRIVAFHAAGLEDVGDLVREVGRIVKEFELPKADE